VSTTQKVADLQRVGPTSCSLGAESFQSEPLCLLRRGLVLVHLHPQAALSWHAQPGQENNASIATFARIASNCASVMTVAFDILCFSEPEQACLELVARYAHTVQSIVTAVLLLCEVRPCRLYR